jgi:hypothetical protein
VADIDPNSAISINFWLILLFLGSDLTTAGGTSLDLEVILLTPAGGSPVLILASSRHFL